ncbi:hypothetical protein [Halopiger aswanensis]|uniref:Hydrolase of HD superfamily n=1 Tax=Halopiger aswanensis TaxID=148449 RepID=A0A3R7D979_9EURY|nr:hypothetical protein [Halopiger aswanensis]RKD94009.1 hypothetical protein ATJ93_3644 [Halopiger aswanensis]
MPESDEFGDGLADASTAADLERALENLADDVATLEAALLGPDGADPTVTATEPDPEQRARFEAVAGRLQDLLAATDGGHRPINTRSGKQITPLEPDPDAIVLEDIAHALSNLSRFAGQGREFYAVARHAVHVSREVEVRSGSPAAQRWGLLHDASEAYFADVPAPVKRSLPGYTRAEKRFQAAVRDAFDLALSPEDERLVDEVDAAVGRYELVAHFPAIGYEAPDLEYVPPWFGSAERTNSGDATVMSAKALFLERARELGLD